MKPITVLLIDPRTPRRPTASIVRLLPDCKAFATVLGCSETRQSVLPDGTPIVVNDGPLEDHYDRLVGGYVYVMRKSWPDAICGPLLVTGPLDKHNRPTSLPSEALRTSPQPVYGRLADLRRNGHRQTTDPPDGSRNSSPIASSIFTPNRSPDRSVRLNPPEFNVYEQSEHRW